MQKTVIVCGSPGAGKSTYGKQLAKKTGAVFLDIDTATQRLVQLALSQSAHSIDDRDSDYFKRTFRQPVYDQLFDIAKENLSHIDVVIAGPFTREIRDPNWRRILEQLLDCPVEIVYIYCNRHIRKERLIRRANPRDAAKLKDWDDFNTYYGDEAPPVFRHKWIDNSTELENQT